MDDGSVRPMLMIIGAASLCFNPSYMDDGSVRAVYPLNLLLLNKLFNFITPLIFTFQYVKELPNDNFL